MAQKKSDRAVAVEILEQVEQGGYLNLVLNNSLKGYDRTRRSFITALVYTTLENLIRIDYCIDSFLSSKKVHHFVRNVLRTGVCQLLYFESVPTSAAVNESVKIIASSKKRELKGFCNAVLRNISNNLGTIEYPDEDEDPVGYLSVMYSYPKWLVEKYIADYGYDFTSEMLSYSRNVNEICIRANTRKISKEALVDKLQAREMFSRTGQWSENAIYIKNVSQIEDDELFRDGSIAIQGEASMLVCEAADLKGGDRVLDLCAAPGGKSAYIRTLEDVSVDSYDIHPHRVKLMKELYERLGLDISAGVNDATIFREELEEKYDVVLVDAPCSALGLLYRKPDIKHNKKEDDLDALTATERKILENAVRYARPGGQIIYSTCTIDRKENADLISGFLEEHSEVHPGELKGLKDVFGDRAENGMIQLFPHMDGIDGFFIAKLVKNG